MKADGDILVTLAVQFAIMSLLALGGANAVVPEIHRQAVELRGWMTERQFADMFAISQAAPGPNVMLVTLIGYHVAGFAGALVTTLAMCGPTAVLAHFLGRTWDRFKDAPWRIAVQAGLVPISVGLVGASAIVLTARRRPQLGRGRHHRRHRGHRLLDALESALADRGRGPGRAWPAWSERSATGKSRLLFAAETCLLGEGMRESGGTRGVA